MWSAKNVVFLRKRGDNKRLSDQALGSQARGAEYPNVAIDASIDGLPYGNTAALWLPKSKNNAKSRQKRGGMTGDDGCAGDVSSRKTETSLGRSWSATEQKRSRSRLRARARRVRSMCHVDRWGGCREDYAMLVWSGDCSILNRRASSCASKRVEECVIYWVMSRGVEVSLGWIGKHAQKGLMHGRSGFSAGRGRKWETLGVR